MKFNELKKYSIKTERQQDKGALKMSQTLYSERDKGYCFNICDNSDGFRQVNLCRGSIFL